VNEETLVEFGEFGKGKTGAGATALLGRGAGGAEDDEEDDVKL
jgi:hypothetical protein